MLKDWLEYWIPSAVVPPDATKLGSALALMTPGLKLVCLLKLFGQGESALFAPPQLYHRELFQENVPLSLMSDLAAFKGALGQAGQGCLYVQQRQPALEG